MSSWLSSSDILASLWEEVAEHRPQFTKFTDSGNPSKKTLLIHMQLNHSLNGKKKNNAFWVTASVTRCWGQMHSSSPLPALWIPCNHPPEAKPRVCAFFMKKKGIPSCPVYRSKDFPWNQNFEIKNNDIRIFALILVKAQGLSPVSWMLQNQPTNQSKGGGIQARKRCEGKTNQFITASGYYPEQASPSRAGILFLTQTL